MKRLTERLSVCVVAALTVFAAVGTAPGAQDIRFFRIGTGSTGGTYFPIGGLLANIISNPPGSRPCDKGGSCGVPGLIAVAQSTEGSVANIAAIVSGDMESGLSQADIAYWAHTGTGVYAEQGPVESLRFIANLYPESLQIVVRRESGIKTIADLKGKRVSLGAEESGTLVDAQIVMAAYGLGLADIEAVFLRPGPAGDLMQQGELDAFFLVAGAPTNAISDLSRQIDIDLLPIESERIKTLVEEYPFFAPHLLPAETYQGTAETRTVAVGAQWIVSSDVEDDLVYRMTQALWHENTRALLDGGHPKGVQIRLQTALQGAGIPIHDGAARFYREAGLLSAAEKSQQE